MTQVTTNPSPIEVTAWDAPDATIPEETLAMRDTTADSHANVTPASNNEARGE